MTKLIAVLTAVVFVGNLYSQTTSSNTSTQKRDSATNVLSEAVITGSNTAVGKNLIPYTVSVVGEKELKESGSNQLLNAISGRVPSLFVTERALMGFGVSNGGSGDINVSAQTRADSIRGTLKYQLQHYPASQYRDVYKNFMQDYFGPGHILNDTVAAGKYLRYELDNSEKFDGPDYEPTGFEGNFYRINLRLIKDGTIPYDIFFKAFVKSVHGITPPDGEAWMKIWSEIDNEIQSMGLTFENEEQDRTVLEEQFKQGNYIVHHSEAFNEANNFHYRIISKDIFNLDLCHYFYGNE